MPLITWSDKYSTGVTEMDAQHQKLFAILNNMHDAMKSGRSKEAMEPLLIELGSYGIMHFAAEERHMDKAKILNLSGHKLKHQEFVTKVKEFQAQQAEGKLTLTMEIMGFLKKWLVDHILGEDMAYCSK